MQFEWNADKATSNERKHGVSFNEAATVFQDMLSITIADPLHSKYEDRFIDIGYSNRGRLLVVSYTERSTSVRIISSRPATAAERFLYEQR
jgi:uncharacterized DUF497 family protein